MSRWAGPLALAVLVTITAWSWWRVRDASRPWSLTVQVGGTIDHYGDDSLAVSTTTRGLLSVMVTRETVVSEPEGPAEHRALQPGRFVIVRGDAWAAGAPLVARTILVWGTGENPSRRAR
jgi:hypothetical protein